MALNDLSAIIEMPVAVHEQALSRGNHTTGKGAYIVTTDEIVADHRETTSAGAESRRKLSKLSDAVSVILQTVGEDPSREGLLQTPERFAKAMMFFTKGYAEDPAQILRDAIFHEKHRGLVLLKNIEFSSLCEHHLVPFIGKVHIGYIPDGLVVGLSKMARLADVFARRLQVQERMTEEIAHCMLDVLQPRGVAVVVEATHQCMVMRGVQKQAAVTTTTCMLGDMEKDMVQRDDFWKALSLSQ